MYTDLPVLYCEMPVWCSREASVAYCPTKKHSLERQMAVEGSGHGKGAVTCLKRTQTHRFAEKFLNKKWLPMNEEATCKKTVTHFWYRLQLWQLSFFYAFTKLRKAPVTFFMFACQSVRPSAWNSAPTGQICMKFDRSIFFFQNLSIKFNFN
jgi:hypothetical protein